MGKDLENYTIDTTENESELRTQSALRSYLWKWIEVTIKDGRRFKGIFGCIDNEANIVLDRAFVATDTNSCTFIDSLFFFSS